MLGGAAAAQVEPVVDTDSVPWGQLISLCSCRNANLTKPEVVIGRAARNDVVLKSGVVSGKHAFIRIEKGSDGKADKFTIQDNSMNGTIVNGKQLKKGDTAQLDNGCEVCFTPQIKFVFRALDHRALTVEDVYNIGDTLGSGAFAVVKAGVNKFTAEKVAIKIVDKRRFALVQTSRPDALLAEARILQSCEHENVIKFKGLFDSKRYLYIVLEFVDGGELFDKIVDAGRFDEPDAKALCRQLVSAVTYLHKRGISHRDLKPENILLQRVKVKGKTRWRAKISDFGLSRIVNSGSMMTTLAGTPHYLAPEILLSQGGTGYDHAVDVWSLGVILYILLSGVQPFRETHASMSIMEQIKEGRIEFPAKKWARISKEAKSLVKAMLTVDPNKRIKSEELVDHPWLAKQRGGKRVRVVAPAASATASASGSVLSADAPTAMQVSVQRSGSVTTVAAATPSPRDASPLPTPSMIGKAAAAALRAAGGAAVAAAAVMPPPPPTLVSPRQPRRKAGSGGGAGGGAGSGVGVGVGVAPGDDSGAPAGPSTSDGGSGNEGDETGNDEAPPGAAEEVAPQQRPRRSTRASARTKRARGDSDSDDASASASASGSSATAANGGGRPRRKSARHVTPPRKQPRRTAAGKAAAGTPPPPPSPSSSSSASGLLESPTHPVVRRQPLCPYGASCYRLGNPKHVTAFFHPHLAT